MSADLYRGREFILGNARLLDRRRFGWRFDAGTAELVIDALHPYQNDDGGFGSALEPDLRGASSQPVPTEHALQILDEIARFGDRMVSEICDWLMSVSAAEGGVPFVLPSVSEGPHAPWWEPSNRASLNPTAGIVGLLCKYHVEHPWVDQAVGYCWDALASDLDRLGPDDAISVLGFLDNAPDRERADAMFDRLSERILRELCALDPATPGYVKTPLEFAPHPDRPVRRLFADDVIESHLDALADKQQGDGGWPLTWEPPSAAAITEWRGYMTIKWLDVLDNYGQLPH